MQGVLTLEPMEIVYLSSLLGHPGFPFLELDWEAIAEEELSPLMDRCQAQLERRRYIDAGFDGNVVMDEAVYDFISTGATCGMYFQQLISSGSTSRTLYVVGGNKMFEMEVSQSSCRILELFGLHSLQARIISRWSGLRERSVQAESKRLDEEEFVAFVHQATEAGGSMFSLSQYVRESGPYFKQAELTFLTDSQSIWQIERQERERGNIVDCTPSNMHHAMCRYAEWFRQRTVI
jgi:hypothetical protein